MFRRVCVLSGVFIGFGIGVYYENPVFLGVGIFVGALLGAVVARLAE